AAEASIIQLGGAHRDVKGLPGYEAHHMPADSISSLPKSEGPAIAMRPKDHWATESWGPATKAQAYRSKQAALIAKGDFWGAMQMDIQDIEAKFPGRYRQAIDQAIKYAKEKGLIN